MQVPDLSIVLGRYLSYQDAVVCLAAVFEQDLEDLPDGCQNLEILLCIR